MNDSKNKQSLLPVYLITGEDALKRDAVMKRLRARLSSMGDLSFNSDVFEGAEFTGDDVVNACNTIPFASPVRLVEVRDADKLKKADSEPIVGYLDAPCETTVLALIAEKLAKNTRLYKAVAKHGKTAVIDCAPPKARDLPKLVRSMAVGHGVTFSEGAAIALVNLVGEDTVHEGGPCPFRHRCGWGPRGALACQPNGRGQALGVHERLRGTRYRQVPARSAAHEIGIASCVAPYVRHAYPRAHVRAKPCRPRAGPRNSRCAQATRLAREKPCGLGAKVHSAGIAASAYHCT